MSTTKDKKPANNANNAGETGRKVLFKIELDPAGKTKTSATFFFSLTKNVGEKTFEKNLEKVISEMRKFKLFVKVIYYVRKIDDAGVNSCVDYDCITAKGESINDLVVSTGTILKYQPFGVAIKGLLNCFRGY